MGSSLSSPADESKDARRRKVCGQKPGGADAYHLRESCVLKDKPIAANTTSSATRAKTKKIKEYLEKIVKDDKKVQARLSILKARLEKKNSLTPEPLRPGIVLLLANKVIKSNGTGESISSRVEDACDAYNNKVSESKQVVLSPFLEYTVLSHVNIHYDNILRETDTRT